MAKIFCTQTQPDRSRLLLRAGLSIFLFLQIQMPDAASKTSDPLTILTIQEAAAEKKVAIKPVEKKLPEKTAAFQQKIALLTAPAH